jgi:hypothetical protein
MLTSPFKKVKQNRNSMTSLNVSADVKLRFIDKKISHYFNRNTILFGASESGKSTVLFEILYLLKDVVPLIFVFSLTAEENNAFDGMVPEHVLFRDINIPLIEAIYKRQKGATRIYNTVNNIKSLKALFCRVASHGAVESAKNAFKNAARIIGDKEGDLSMDFSDRKSALCEVKKVRDEYLTKLYKHEIRINKKRLRRMGLSENEKYIVKYLDFNPHCTIVFDDCGAILKKFQKEEVIKKIMYQGRHNKLHAIFTLQDDTDMASFIKKQSKINIFTTDQCASAYFERKSNSFPKKTKTKADNIISYVFAETTKKKNHKKLMYLRGEPDPFRYTIADLYDTFEFGSPALWKMSKKIKENEEVMSFDDDPLLSSFRINL